MNELSEKGKEMSRKLDSLRVIVDIEGMKYTDGEIDFFENEMNTLVNDMSEWIKDVTKFCRSKVGEEGEY